MSGEELEEEFISLFVPLELRLDVCLDDDEELVSVVWDSCRLLLHE